MKSFLDIIAEEIKKAIIHLPYDFFDYNLDLDRLSISVEKCRNSRFGDFASNWALTLGLSHDKAMYLAQFVCDHINKKLFIKATVTNPGFINLSLSPLFKAKILNQIHTKKLHYGYAKNSKKIIEIEFVSANPTGKLHIGHARNAAIGDTLARILQTQGYRVIREYYINDAGNQIDKLALSVLIRYKQSFGMQDQLPEDSYHADEVIDVAKALRKKYQESFLKLTYNDNSIIDNGQISKKQIKQIKDFSKKYMLDMIRNSLANFGIKFNIWFSESDLYRHKFVDQVLILLKDHTYQKDGALWLKTSEKGDDKDRVLIKSDGQYTYFLPDIAYHVIKMSHEYTSLYNIWGADHKSYADRMKIAMELCGFDASKLHFIIMQMVRLTKNGKEFKMSKRTGESLTLDDLLNAIGKDATRWYMVSQPAESHLEIDVDIATSKDTKSSLYYVQYAYARIHQILTKNKLLIYPKKYDLLNLPIEHEIIAQLAIFPDTLKTIAHNSSVNILTTYLINLAKLFHSYYGQAKIYDPQKPIMTSQRLGLSLAIEQVIKNGLALLDITPMEKM